MWKSRSIAAAAALLAAFVAPRAHAVGVEAALDVKPAWAYIVGGLAGGVGGGVGGFFVEQGDPPESARVSMLLLAGGMVFAIPTTIAILSATAYEPPAEYVHRPVPRLLRRQARVSG
jgi:hypothetical protein